MLGAATLFYKASQVHVLAGRWPEDAPFCLESGSHRIPDAGEFWSAEEFARSVRADHAELSRLRDLVSQEGNVHLSRKMSVDQIFRLTGLLLAQGRLKAVWCSGGAHERIRSAAAVRSLYVAPFHLQYELAAESPCQHGLSHSVRRWTDPILIENFVRGLFDRRDFVPRLRRLASTDGEEVTESDEVVRKRLEHMLVTGHLIAVECPLGARQASRDELAEQQRRESFVAVGRRKPDRVAVKTWIEIRLVDDEGSPVPNEKYLLELPDGSTVEGTLDRAGCARHEDIDPGACKVCFPEIEGRAWRAA